MIALITNFNRLVYTKYMVNWCLSRGLTPVIVDNNSDYPPLLEYYELHPCEIVKLDNNYGHDAIWKKGVLSQLNITGRYIATDPDLNLDNIPADFLKVLNAGLNKYLWYPKCGFSLEINDLPNTEEGKLISTHVEPRYWRRPLDNLYFHAPIDTTFALYREGTTEHFHSAIRTNRPYTAKHLPWYHKGFSSLTEDEQYYLMHANIESATGRDRIMKTK